MKNSGKHFFSLFTSAFLLLPSYLLAQDGGNMYVPNPLKLTAKSTEIGIFVGGSYYTGDLNPAGHFSRFTRPAAGLLYRMNLNTRLSAKAVVSYGLLEADDSYSKNESHRNRNLSFRSKMMEFAVEGEFNFLPFVTGSKKLAITTPYVFAGVAVYHFNPTGFYEHRWYNLQPIGTEGQGSAFSSQKPYSLTQFSIPFGAGLKVNTARKVNINFEWGIRKTFTDYLDDVSGTYVDPGLLAAEKGAIAAALADKSFTQEGGSNTGRQRGNSFTKDWYAFAGVIITFRMKNKESDCDMPH